MRGGRCFVRTFRVAFRMQEVLCGVERGRGGVGGRLGGRGVTAERHGRPADAGWWRACRRRLRAPSAAVSARRGLGCGVVGGPIAAERDVQKASVFARRCSRCCARARTGAFAHEGLGVGGVREEEQYGDGEWTRSADHASDQQCQ